MGRGHHGGVQAVTSGTDVPGMQLSRAGRGGSGRPWCTVPLTAANEGTVVHCRKGPCTTYAVDVWDAWWRDVAGDTVHVQALEMASGIMPTADHPLSADLYAVML